MTRFLLTLLLFLTLSFSTALSQNATTPNGAKARLGFNLGWEHPYSAGMELAVTIREAIDLNGGFGIGLSGFKAGVGCRIYPMHRLKWSPMIGAHFFGATGFGNVTITSNEDEAEYEILSSKGLLINAGLRCRMNNDDYFLMTAGYSQALKGGGAIYLNGSQSSSIEKIADIMGVGGFSFSLTYLIRLGR